MDREHKNHEKVYCLLSWIVFFSRGILLCRKNDNCDRKTCWQGCRLIQIDYVTFFLAAFLLMILPLDWFVAALISAVWHEICHFTLVFLLNGKILGLTIRPDGWMIEVNQMTGWQQFLCILAGPFGSLSLLLLYRFTPKVAVCGLVHGLYNLLPVFPLDGGRMLQLFAFRICPRYAEIILYISAFIICIGIDCFAVWFFLSSSGEVWPIATAVIWNIKFLAGNITCKPSEMRVQ